MKKGVTLLEVLVASLLLSVVVVAMLKMEVDFYKINKKMALIQEGNMILQKKFETFKGKINRGVLISFLREQNGSKVSSKVVPNVNFTLNLEWDSKELPLIDNNIEDDDRKGILEIDAKLFWVENGKKDSLVMFTRSNY
ncbi:MAG: hypothetical protein CR982_00555 [Candidatus Cloacimonadota bacterium]|nr:MAG: hypothetical protein CR982_00555 [Candidatus Cloacimonadota bacterium]PIE78876.1 MAG: hypothetical protein CSA15_05655 [Candidatus Delongbacteria bacterium]